MTTIQSNRAAVYCYLRDGSVDCQISDARQFLDELHNADIVKLHAVH